jgi:hypothetical protein
MADSKPPLLVFADDWGRHPSSCQHLVRRLLSDHEVIWVNTIGMRSPRLDLSTLRRGMEKLQHWSCKQAPGAALPAGLRVVNPRMWPSFRSRFARWVNRKLLLQQLAPLCQSLREPPVAVTALPIVADLMGRLPVRSWVYYCVDDFGQWPGLDQERLRQMDDEVIARADVLIAVSETLQERIRERGREAHLLTHGVEIDFWRTEEAPVPELAHLPRPLMLFWGAVDRRMDLAFVRRLAEDLSAGTIVLVGPKADPDPILDEIPRVVHLGQFAFERLPHLAREANVLIMPYADLPVTRAMQPLKLKEYLATGKPTVVRGLPATFEWGDCLDLTNTPEAFSAAVRQRLAEGLPQAHARGRGRLDKETWAEKAKQFEQWALPGRPRREVCHAS